MKTCKKLYHLSRAVALVSLFVIVLVGCGEWGGGAGVGVGAPSPAFVSGVAAAGAPISGNVYLKDSANHEIGPVPLGADGSFSFDVTGLTPPFYLFADGNVGLISYKLYSVTTSSSGIANINPLTNAIVAAAAGGIDPAIVYGDPAAHPVTNDNLDRAITNLQTMLGPLLAQYDAEHVNPISDSFRADHTKLDAVFDLVAITVASSGGDVTVTVTDNLTEVMIAQSSTGDLEHPTTPLTPENVPADAPSSTAPTTVPGNYSTIQAAIDAVPAGTRIRIAAGTHTEVRQILVHKNVSIVGVAGSRPIIKLATNLPQTNNVAGAWFLISPNVTFSLSNVVLDGNEFKVYQAVRSHGMTTIKGVDFRNIRDNAAPYVGVAIANFGGTISGGTGLDTHGSGGAPSTLTVIKCTFQQIGRIGILTKGTAATATISNNTYTGKGNGDFLDYAFEVGASGIATITGNTISDNRGVATTDGSTSAGILVTDYYGDGTRATITGNTISNSTGGIMVGYDATDASVVVAHKNKFSGNSKGVNSTHPPVDAIHNWWGDASGPTHPSNSGGTGDGVSDYVNFDSYCHNSACTP